MAGFTEYFLKRESQESGLTFSEVVQIVQSEIGELDPYLPEQNEKLGKLAQICLGEPMQMGQELTTQDKMRHHITEMELACQREKITTMFNFLFNDPNGGNEQINVVD